MRVLFVKLTSMGDLIHALPALSDLQQVHPEITVDWIADEAFAEIASWHPLVKNVFKSAHRRWRKNWWQAWRSGELTAFYRAIRATHYDLIIDGQTNLKSAIVTGVTRGEKHGPDRQSVREYGAQWFYHHHYPIAKDLHAVERLRRLFAAVFNYPLPTTPPNFGLQRAQFALPATLNLPARYLLFVHNASWVTKLWPESYWRQLIEIALEAGYAIVLPSGNAEEAERAQRLAAGDPRVFALPKLSLTAVAGIIAHAEAAVCVDTGLSHLTGALEIPAVTLYGATDSGLIGAPGQRQVYLQAELACAPCYNQTCHYLGESPVKPACYAALTPMHVWTTLQRLLPTEDLHG